MPRSATSVSSRRCCWTSTPRSAPRPRCRRPGSSSSSWSRIRVTGTARQCHRGAAHRRRRPAPGVRHRRTARRITRSPRTAATSATPWTERGVQYGPAFTGLASRAHRRAGGRHACWPRSPCPARSAPNKTRTACTQRCWMPASSPWAPVRRYAALGDGALALPLAARRAALLRLCPQRPLLLYPGYQSRRPRRSRPTSTCWTSTERSCSRVQGLRCGTGTSEGAQQDRMLGERLLTIEWQQRELPEPDHAKPATGC